jgi:XTP/dITP diphosphohydrolase
MPIDRLLVATTNPGKAREFRELLDAHADRPIGFDDLSAHRDLPAIEETGLTFRANAALKASGYARARSCWTLADDSGLEVDALGGRPGVHSARWAELHGAGRGDADNNALVLRQLREKAAGTADWPVFAARFVCVLALADPDGTIVLTTRGTVEGRILDTPRGVNGFGYDPLFLIGSAGQTTAELPAERKHAVSHRGNALRRMRALMLRHGLVA